MNAAAEKLMAKTVAEVMSQEVVTVGVADSMDHAADLITSHDVHGLAVVDEMGRCVGVLASSDFVRRSRQQCDSHRDAQLPMQEHRAVREAEAYRIVAESVDAVGTYMSDSLQSIPPTCTLAEAAEIMRSGQVQRLPVLDEDHRPVGMLTCAEVMGSLLDALQAVNTPDAL